MAHGKSLELAKITRALPVAVHEHTMHTTKRYDLYGGVANRKTRRAYARDRRMATIPDATLLPYEKA